MFFFIIRNGGKALAIKMTQVTIANEKSLMKKTLDNNLPDLDIKPTTNTAVYKTTTIKRLINKKE